MTAIEEIVLEGRRILARHGMADHTLAAVVYIKRGTVPPEDTVAAICEFYNLKLSSLLGKTRVYPLPVIRQILCYLLYCESGLCQKSISEIVKRDHSTISYSISKMRKCLSVDKKLFREIELLRGHVHNYGNKSNNIVP